jgi:hypothetical protein
LNICQGKYASGHRCCQLCTGTVTKIRPERGCEKGFKATVHRQDYGGRFNIVCEARC